MGRVLSFPKHENLNIYNNQIQQSPLRTVFTREPKQVEIFSHEDLILSLGKQSMSHWTGNSFTLYVSVVITPKKHGSQFKNNNNNFKSPNQKHSENI